MIGTKQMLLQPDEHHDRSSLQIHHRQGKYPSKISKQWRNSGYARTTRITGIGTARRSTDLHPLAPNEHAREFDPAVPTLPCGAKHMPPIGNVTL